MIKHPAGRRGWLALALLLSANAHAAISFTDIQIWAGSGPNQAAMVVDWGNGNTPLVWGYRWADGASPTGSTMLNAIVGVDSRLNVPGLTLSTAFVNRFRYDADNNGSYELDATNTPGPAFEPYWGYSVNNAVYFHPTDFSQNSHIVSPNTTVIPNGNPYDAISPGSWVGSSTGILDRPLVNGSWDGYAYGNFNLTTFNDPAPGANPMAAAPIPEPATLLAFASLLLLGKRKRRWVAGSVLAGALTAHAGPYAPGVGVTGTTAIPANSSAFQVWANAAPQFTVGYYQIDTPAEGFANYGTASDALGISDATTDDPYNIVSLGDDGSITLTFPTPLGNGLGWDFAVFENSFTNNFLELAFVEVSSNGTDFFRFPASSLTPSTTQISGFGTIDPTNLNNLAGKYRAGYGTPFDLDELKHVSAKLNVNRVTHVRIIDVVGSINPTHARRDAANLIINDPFPTPYDSAGFDLDAVGGLNLTDAGRNLWAKRTFSPAELANPAVSGMSADPNRNGIPNLLEYALNRHPLTQDERAPMAMSSGVKLTLTFTRVQSNTDLIYSIQRSTTGTFWEDVANNQLDRGAIVPLGVISGLTVQETSTVPATVTVSIPKTGAKAMFRLKVTTV